MISVRLGSVYGLRLGFGLSLGSGSLVLGSGFGLNLGFWLGL